MTLDTLLKLALMASDNRAAHALARAYPGGETAFAEALQRKAAALRLEHTTLRDATGLSNANRASAADIGRIIDAAAAYPQIARDTTTLADTVEAAGSRLSYRNTNPLVGAGTGTCACPRPATRPKRDAAWRCACISTTAT